MILKWLKKKLNCNYWLVIFVFTFGNCFAQTVVNIPESFVKDKSTPYSETLISGNVPTISIGATINIRADKSLFQNQSNSAYNLNTNSITTKITSIGGITLGSPKDIILSTSNQSLYTIVLGLLPGNVEIQYKTSLVNQTLLAGNYTETIYFTTISPNSRTLTINIPAYITASSTQPPLTINISNLSQYRNATGVSLDHAISLSSTLMYNLKAKSSAANFVFTPNVNPPAIATNTVNLKSNITGSIPINLNNSYQTLATNATLPTNNTQSYTLTYSVSMANLNQKFVRAGTYTTTTDYVFENTTEAKSSTLSQTLEITVADMAELVTLDKEVKLVFNTPSNYTNGVTSEYAQNIQISKTTPFDLYVKASTANFEYLTNKIPVGVLKISAATAETTNINNITLSTTAQKLITNANPAIDQKIGLKYSIPASETSKLIGVPRGQYVADIIFSFTQP